MPYIKEEDREALGFTYTDVPTNAGELNYCLTRVIQMYQDSHGLSYKTINDIIGALQGAQLEFYRRVAAPYEDKKIKENGDVY